MTMLGNSPTSEDGAEGKKGDEVHPDPEGHAGIFSSEGQTGGGSEWGRFGNK